MQALYLYPRLSSLSASLSFLKMNKKLHLRLEHNKSHYGFYHDNHSISIYPPGQLPLSLSPSQLFHNPLGSAEECSV